MSVYLRPLEFLYNDVFDGSPSSKLDGGGTGGTKPAPIDLILGFPLIEYSSWRDPGGFGCTLDCLLDGTGPPPQPNLLTPPNNKLINHYKYILY